jgi:hypothetical protein
LLSQALPDCVQKRCAPLPPQQFWPMPPQFEQEPELHVPRFGPQVVPAVTQTEPLQQPVPEQVAFAQQAWPAPPQATNVPWPLHTMPAEAPVPFSPGGTHRPDAVSRHAPPWQLVPDAHAGWKGPPQVMQVFAEQARVVPLQV